MSKMQMLAAHVPKIMQDEDTEKGNSYQDIFLEIGKSNVKEIIQNGEIEILAILLDLMGMGCLKEDQIIENGSLRIAGRHQTSFWRELIKQVSQFGSEAYKLEVITKFQSVFSRLIT
tara:strand:+ start:473 stop:823 length:351 start_codon:yes stop_codon:yes gene_type:complete